MAVVEVGEQLGVRPVLVGRRNSLTLEFQSLHLLHGLGAVADARGDAPVALRSSWCSGFRSPRVARERWVTPRR